MAWLKVLPLGALRSVGGSTKERRRPERVTVVEAFGHLVDPGEEGSIQNRWQRVAVCLVSRFLRQVKVGA